MNIALFTDCYLPSKNGVVTVVNQLRESLTALGHHVVIVTVKPTDVEVADDPDIYRTTLRLPPGLGMKDQYMGFAFMPKLIQFLKKHQIEIIHVHTEFGIGQAGYRAARMLHIPVVATMHTMWEDYYQYYLPGGNLIPVDVIRALMNHYYKHFHCIVGVSEKTRKYAQQPFIAQGIPTVVIPNALNPADFFAQKCDAVALRKNLDIQDDEVMLLFVGRIAEEKRIFELIDQCAIVLKAELKAKAVIVGDGPALKYVQKMADAYGVSERIRFPGFLDWQQVHSYYEAADVFMNASLSETYSMTTLEAMLAQTPVVCRADDSITDRVIHGVTGMLAQTDEELAEYLIELVRNKDDRKRMGLNAKNKAKEFLPDAFARRYERVYRELLASYPNGMDEAAVQAALDAITSAG